MFPKTLFASLKLESSEFESLEALSLQQTLPLTDASRLREQLNETTIEAADKSGKSK